MTYIKAMLTKYQKYIRCLIWILLVAICIALGVFFGHHVAFSTSLPIFDSLQNISAVIIAITGVWIAVLYPTFMVNLQNNKKNFINLTELFAPIFISLFILITIICIKILAVMLKNIELSFISVNTLRIINFSSLLILSGLQIVALFITFLPFYSVRKNIKLTEQKNKKDNDC